MKHLRNYIRSILLEEKENLFRNWPNNDIAPPGFNPKIWSLLSGLKDPILEIDMSSTREGRAVVYDRSETIDNVSEEPVAEVLFVDNGTVFGKCLGSYHIAWSETHRPGHGPLAYDLALEWVTYLGSSLVNDRTDVSEPARDVWSIYARMRKDVQKKQLDIIGSPLTSTPEDDCVDYTAADNYGYYDAYPDVPPNYGLFSDDHLELQQMYLSGKIPLKNLQQDLKPDPRYLEDIQDPSEPFMKAYEKYPLILIGWAVRNKKMRLVGRFAADQWQALGQWDI